MKSCTFSQKLPEEKMRVKEAEEIAQITDCIKLNKKVDGLIEWDVDGSGEIGKIFRSDGTVESGFSFEYRSRLGFFIIDNNTNGIFLKEINYFRNSFQKTIFLDDTSSNYEITSETRFKVWMSKDTSSIYFCLMSSDSPLIWVLSNENNVYLAGLN
jgi:hypothetical protein